MRRAVLRIVRRKRGWYWHMVAPNGRIVASGGEPFARRWTARRSFERARSRMIRALLEVRA
jgi:hypothetical protein